MDIANALENQTPAGVLGEGMDHMVEEANAGVDADDLRGGVLCGVGGSLFEGRFEEGLSQEDVAAVQRQGNLDLGFVGVSDEGGGSSVGHFVQSWSLWMVGF